MENNVNTEHILWQSPDQQTEVWMQQVSGKTPEEKKEQSRAGYRLLAGNGKNENMDNDFWKETDPVVRTETGKPYLRLHLNCFLISVIRGTGSPARWEMHRWGLISSITEK